MYDIYYKRKVVASANSFTDAKLTATIYRRAHFITNWQDVTFKKRTYLYFINHALLNINSQ